MREPQEVQVESISQELLKSKESLIPSQKGAFFNLIVYAKDEAAAFYSERLTQTLLEKFPCHVIYIKAKDGEKILSTQSTSQEANRSKTGVSSDRLLIEVSKDQFSKVPYLVFPNLSPELPICLMWGENPINETEVLPLLLPYASQLIFEGADLQLSDLPQLDALGKYCQHLKSKEIECVDINWSLLKGWRKAFRDVFDSKTNLNLLQNTKFLKIYYNNDTRFKNRNWQRRALYFVGWLASCLDWKFEKVKNFNGAIQFVFKKEDQEIEVNIQGEYIPGIHAGAISNVQLVSTNKESFSFTNNPATKSIEVHHTAREACELPLNVLLPDFTKGLTLLQDIFYTQTNLQYLKMLTVLSQFHE